MDGGIKLTFENPKNKANILSKLLFIWVIQLFKDAITVGVTITDIFITLNEDLSEKACGRLDKKWTEELKRAKEKSRKPNLMWTLLRTFFSDYLSLGIAQFMLYVVFVSLQPLTLAYLIKCFAPEMKGEPYLEEKLYTLGAMIVLLSIVVIFIYHHTSLGQTHVGMRMRVAVSALAYRKMLRLSKKSLGETPMGTIVNLLSNDVSRLDYFCLALHFWWIPFFQVFVMSYLIWTLVGVSAMAGIVSTILLTLPLQGILSKLVTKIRGKTAIRTDRRVKLMNEIISGIQVIKMYAWEKPFEKMVETLRLDEVKFLTVASYIRGFMLSCMVFIERSSLYITLITYTCLGQTITADKVFSLAQFYNLLQMALAINLQNAFSFGAEAWVACQRVAEFLMLEEIEESKVEVGEGGGVLLKEVSAKWSGDDFRVTLDGINLEIPAGKLCVVIGPVGAGKSSLLHLLLGELVPSSGNVSLHGSIAYCSQEPWLFRATVRNNILFGQEYNKELYSKVIKTCALATDFRQFPNGDKTIVGERGVSLSGGQRARINLARAVYRNADIYLLDDPLSAVDTHVGKHLFEQCLVRHLRGKTRILVTHQLQFLKNADLIIAMNKGKIEIMGTYDDLAKSDIDITKLMVAADESPDDEKPKKNLSRKISVLSTNTIQSIDNEGTEIVQEDNEEEVGLQGKSAFKEYFLAAGRGYVVVLVGIVIVLGQVFAGAADFWVTIWTEQETEKLGIHTETLLINDTIQNNEYYKYETGPSSIYTMKTSDSIYVYTGIILGLIFLTIARSLAFFKITMTASKNLHSQMFHSLLKAKMRFFDTNPSGRILNRFSKDMGVVDELLPRVMMETIQILLVMVSIFVLVAITNYFMIIAIIVLGSLFWMLRRWFLTTAKILKHLEGTSKSPVFSHINSSFNGITTIRACQAEEQLIKEFDNHQDVNTSAWYLTLVCIASFGLWLDIISVLFTAVVVFSSIAMQESGVSGSSVGLAITQSLILTGMLQYGIRQSSEVVNQMISVERILQYTTLDEERPFESPEEKDWPKQGRITLKHMNLRYAENELPVLCDMNVTINSGEKIGIVGRTGAGKSSLISSIFRLAIIDGSIEIDGVDTKSVGLSELRRKISIIPQEPVLFSASLRFNLDPFGEFKDEKLWNVLEEVELKEVISSLDFEVDEGGANFSLGQRQLICLARAILRNNKILVLDEATANVDLKTDELIQTTIRRKFTDCTVLTIAHRLNTIMDSDKILVMDHGSVAEFDHPHILLQNVNGVFTGMVRQTGPQMTRNLTKTAEDAFNKKFNRTRL